ncbi:MAG: trehalose-phosphatase [Candidatus Melainabacteria bacterium]|nr:trehalose-phosphatase [Candidatus Melainabacteria bacterium]
MQTEILAAVQQALSASQEVFLVFDRDGTLVPISPLPDATSVSPLLLCGLADLVSAGAHVAILSARGLTCLSRDFPSTSLMLAGNSGLEIISAEKVYFCEARAAASRGLISKAREALSGWLSPQYGAILEDHELSLCLHWHLVPMRFLPEVFAIVDRFRSAFGTLSVRTLPTSFEIWPPVVWDKGFGLEQMTAMLRLKRAPLVLYAGDAEPDEAAFAWVNAHRGVSIRVGSSRKTEAQFCLSSCGSLVDLIAALSLLRS